MSDAAVRYEQRGPAAWITLDSPGNRNALSGPLVDQLGGHLRRAMEDDAVRAVVLTGTGPAFCAGADLKHRGDAVAPGAERENPFVGILRLVWEGPKPVVGAINGHAFGGGLGLVAACDITVAADTAKFSFSEVRLGLIPAMISVVVLPKLGPHQTMRLFLTGERFTADAARDYGLLHRVVPPTELEEAAQAEVDAIAAGGPIAIAKAKQLVRSVARLPMDEAFAYAEREINALFRSEEAAEGMAAFAAKRKPSWVEKD